MSYEVNSTKLEIVGKCVRVIEPRATDPYPKLQIWVEIQDGKYKTVIPFECKAEYAKLKFCVLPMEGDMVRCGGFIGGRVKDTRCYVTIRLRFMRVEGAGRAFEPASVGESFIENTGGCGIDDQPPDETDLGEPMPY